MTPAIQVRWLPAAMLTYGAGSFIHHVHNATFLHEYPNLPLWLSSAGVYAAWCGVTAVGVGGLALVHRGYPLAGLVVLALSASYGLDGLGHYAVAPVSAHTLTMNVTIWLEVTTAMLLLVTVAIVTWRLLTARRRTAP